MVFAISAPAAALILSGASAMMKKSSPPKAKWKDSIVPPRPSISFSTASYRFDPPSFKSPFMPSPTYEPEKRYFGMFSLLPVIRFMCSIANVSNEKINSYRIRTIINIPPFLTWKISTGNKVYGISQKEVNSWCNNYVCIWEIFKLRLSWNTNRENWDQKQYQFGRVRWDQYYY